MFPLTYTHTTSIHLSRSRNAAAVRSDDCTQLKQFYGGKHFMPWKGFRQILVKFRCGCGVRPADGYAAPQAKQRRSPLTLRSASLRRQLRPLPRRLENVLQQWQRPPNQLAHVKASASANKQINALTDLVMSLLKVMEELRRGTHDLDRSSNHNLHRATRIAIGLDE